MAALISELLQVLKAERDEAQGELDKFKAIAGDHPPPSAKEKIEDYERRIVEIGNRIWDLENKARATNA